MTEWHDHGLLSALAQIREELDRLTMAERANAHEIKELKEEVRHLRAHEAGRQY